MLTPAGLQDSIARPIDQTLVKNLHRSFIVVHMSWHTVILLAPLCISVKAIGSFSNSTGRLPFTPSELPTTSSSTKLTPHIADFILQGLGASSDTKSISTSTLATYVASSDNSINTTASSTRTGSSLALEHTSTSSSRFPILSVYTQNGTHLLSNATGTRINTTSIATGYAAASKCQTDIYSWLNASSVYATLHATEFGKHIGRAHHASSQT